MIACVVCTFSDNVIKNRWNSTIRRKILKNELPHAVLSAVSVAGVGISLADSPLHSNPGTPSTPCTLHDNMLASACASRALEALVSQTPGRASAFAESPCSVSAAGKLLFDGGTAPNASTGSSPGLGVAGRDKCGDALGGGGGSDMLKALHMDGAGLRKSGLKRKGVFREGARKLRVDVEMPHEDQEALDALRLLSSGYGAHSPQYDSGTEEALVEETAATPGTAAGDDAEGKAGGTGGKKKDARCRGSSGPGGGRSRGMQLQLSATPVDPTSMVTHGEGLVTPHKPEPVNTKKAGSALRAESGRSVVGDSGAADAGADARLDSETAAAIWQWGLAMSQIPSLGVNNNLTPGTCVSGDNAGDGQAAALAAYPGLAAGFLGLGGGALGDMVAAAGTGGGAAAVEGFDGSAGEVQLSQAALLTHLGLGMPNSLASPEQQLDHHRHCMAVSGMLGGAQWDLAALSSACNINGFNGGLNGLHALNALKLAHLASLFNVSGMQGAAVLAAGADDAGVGSHETSSTTASATSSSPEGEQDETSKTGMSALGKGPAVAADEKRKEGGLVPGAGAVTASELIGCSGT